MALSDIVNVVIVTTNPGITAPGFGIPMLESCSATWTERTRTYNNIAGVGGDFATTTVEYRQANTVFSQSPAPPTIMIGRFANKPTQVFTVSIATVVSVAGTAYKVRINDLSSGANGAGIGQTATFTTVGSDTNDSIITGLSNAVTALAISGVTASITGSGGSHKLVITMTSAKWVGIEIYDTSPGTVGNLMTIVETDSAAANASADLDAIANESTAWYGLLLAFKGDSRILAAAGWAESNGKLFIVSSLDSAIATTAYVASSGSDPFNTLRDSARARTGAFFHPRNDEFADAAEMGRFFPINPGRDNWRLKTLSGPTPCNLTATQISNIKSKYANFYYVLGGVNVIGGDGKVSDNEYIDVIRFRDWYVVNLQVDLVNLLIQNEKVPYTDAGIGLVEAVIRARNDSGIAAGGIAPTPRPVVNVPKVGNVSTSDKQNRVLNNANTTWTLAGALNKLNVNVQVNF